MCLLFTQVVADRKLKLNDDQLADMYRSNKDGFGVMFAKDGMLHTNKGIGTVADWIAFYRKYEDVDAAFHLRMRTHGHIDLTNCHPYDVYGFEEGQEYTVPMALMHNGVLRFNNTKDLSKSDTWHYIRDWLRPLLDDQPKLMFNATFQKLIADHIGPSNKFCVMDNEGNMAVINRQAGTEWNGMWFSNTYAWSADDNILYPGRPERTYTTYGSKGYNYGWSSDTTKKSEVSKTPTNSLAPVTTVHSPNTGKNGSKKKATRFDRIQRINEKNAETMDYVNAVLDQDLPAIGSQIGLGDREAVVRRFTPFQVEQVLEDAFMGHISPEDVVRMFKEPSRIYNWLLGEQVNASVGKLFVESQDADEAEASLDAQAIEMNTGVLVTDEAEIAKAMQDFLEKNHTPSQTALLM